MHGSKYANLAMTESDLIIACGARFSDRVTGKLSEFAPHADVIHIDIDPAEIGKIRKVQIPIVGDLRGVLAGINEAVAKAGRQAHHRTLARPDRRVAPSLPVLPLRPGGRPRSHRA